MLENKTKILIIEDDLNILETTAEYLSLENYNVIKATDGDEGIKMAIKHFPDLILCDINMPKVNGYDVFLTLQNNYFTSLIPFIFLTAKSEKEDIFKGMQLGANDYIVKPFNYDILLNTIKIRLQKYGNLINTNEEKFSAIIKNSADWIWISDMYGNITFSNDVCEEITGFNKNNILGNTILDYIPIYEFADISSNHNTKFNKEKLKNNFEHVVKRADGTNVNVDVSTSIILNNENKVAGIVGTHRNITAKKQIETLEKNIEIAKTASLLKQQFLANMSHEMRTPLNCIIGMLDFMLKTELNDKQLNYAETIKSFSETLLKIINDILDLSKIESGKFDLENVNFKVEDIFENSKSVFNSLVKGKNIEFVEVTDEAIPEHIFADKMRINQIITNYISNAIKFTETGTITIKYTLLNKLTTDNKLEIKVEVIDTGKGISNENIEKLFNTYSQLNNSRIKNVEGTGLGLSICKKLAELMNGEVGVYSEINKGSNFWFTFEAEKVAKFEEVISKIDNNDFEGIKLNLNILLVEDKYINQAMTKLLLKDANCQIDIAENGQIALEMYKQDKYDIILMYIQMPIMDGITTTSILRQRYKKLPPIIAVTADVIDLGSKELTNKGFDDLLPKPITIESIYTKLLKWKEFL